MMASDKKGESEGRVGFLALSSCLSVCASSFVFLFSGGCLFVLIFAGKFCWCWSCASKCSC